MAANEGRMLHQGAMALSLSIAYAVSAPGTERCAAIAAERDKIAVPVW